MVGTSHGECIALRIVRHQAVVLYKMGYLMIIIQVYIVKCYCEFVIYDGTFTNVQSSDCLQIVQQELLKL